MKKYTIVNVEPFCYIEGIRHDLQFIKGFVGIASNVPDGEVIEVLKKMFKQKKIGQLIDGKKYKISLDSDL